jgi:hypothetical protein
VSFASAVYTQNERMERSLAQASIIILRNEQSLAQVTNSLRVDLKDDSKKQKAAQSIRDNNSPHARQAKPSLVRTYSTLRTWRSENSPAVQPSANRCVHSSLAWAHSPSVSRIGLSG